MSLRFGDPAGLGHDQRHGAFSRPIAIEVWRTPCIRAQAIGRTLCVGEALGVAEAAKPPRLGHRRGRVACHELKPKTVGNIHWDREKKTAVIRVLDPADYHQPFDEVLRDIEFTVVHELIHLEMVPVLSDLQRTEENRREEEHAVNHMAEALLKLDRGR